MPQPRELSNLRSNPRALSSALTTLEMLQPCNFGLLNRLFPLVLVSNYYIHTPISTRSAHVEYKEGLWVCYKK